MTEQKHIEEMAKVIDEFTEPLSARDIHKAEFSEQFAEHLYTAGYRKQSEGEWLTDKYGMDRSVCSLCNACYDGDVGRYCPNCGAHMTKGERK